MKINRLICLCDIYLYLLEWAKVSRVLKENFRSCFLSGTGNQMFDCHFCRSKRYITITTLAYPTLYKLFSTRACTSKQIIKESSFGGKILVIPLLYSFQALKSFIDIREKTSDAEFL